MSSLSSVFSTAISGLDASQTTINVTGNNVANSDTVGFKSSNALFATQFAQTLSAGTAPQGVAGGVGGGTDPIQIGLGVEVATIQTDFTQGSIQTTSNPYDLAIQGNGFFSVEEPTGSSSSSSNTQASQAQTFFTRNGQFQLNASNQLTTSSGQLLLGYPVNSNFVVQNSGTTSPLSIPLGQKTVAKATTDVTMQGTLPPSSSIATTAQIQTSAILGDSSWTTPPSGTNASASDIPTVTAPTTTDDPSVPAGLGVSSSTTYSYEFAFYDPSSNTYGTPSAPVSVTTGPSDNEVDFTNLPTDPNYSQLGIFRQNASGSYALVANVDPTATPTYQDTTPDATLATQTTTLSSSELTGNYSYYVTYSTANGTESRPSALVGPVNVVNGTIQLTNIPSAPAPNGNNYTQINIYRNTTAEPTQYQLLTSIPQTVGQTYSYTDDTPDATLSSKSGASPLQQGAVLSFNGPAATPNTLLTNILVQTPTGTQQLLPGGTLSYAPEIGSNTLTPKTFTITSTSTVQNLMDFMSQASGITLAPGSDTPPVDSSGAKAGVTINQQGQIVVTSYNGTNSAISVPLGALTLNNGSGNQEVDLSFSTAQQATGTGATANIIAYDSLGDAVNVTVTAELQSESAAGTVYRWYADSSDNQGSNASINVGTGLVTFDGNGNFVNATNETVTVNRDQVAAVNPLTFTLDFSKVSGLASQSASLASSTQDGFLAPGTLSSFNIGSDGTITGVFSNGTQRSLGQVALTTFTNPQGLVAQGQNLFVQGPNSGDPITNQPGQAAPGTITSGALEQSNTDVGQSLVDLITASTQYQGNARVISTANTLLQDLLQLGQLG